MPKHEQCADCRHQDCHSVHRLRCHELAASTRPFIARGSRIQRCSRCLLAEHLCLCGSASRTRENVAVCLVYHKGEVFKPSNSGRLIADVLPDNHAFLWHRVTPPAGLKALLDDPAYLPVLVFPFQHASPDRRLDTDSKLAAWLAQTHQQNKEQQVATNPATKPPRPLLVLLDGTWREARKMFRSEWLNHLPVLGIEGAGVSEYALRDAFHDHQLGTAEVTIAILNRLGFTISASLLQQHTRRFMERYLAAKPARTHLPASQPPAE